MLETLYSYWVIKFRNPAMTHLSASPAGLTRGSIFFAKSWIAEVKPGNDAAFVTQWC
jgi:hypothetical protein